MATVAFIGGATRVLGVGDDPRRLCLLQDTRRESQVCVRMLRRGAVRMREVR